MPSIQQTANLVQEISTASMEQSIGAQQITDAIRELDNVIQQNTSSSVEAASVSDALASNSAGLETIIATFQIARDGVPNHAMEDGLNDLGDGLDKLAA